MSTKKTILYLITLFTILGVLFYVIWVNKGMFWAGGDKVEMRQVFLDEVNVATTTTTISSSTGQEIITPEEWAVGREERIKQAEEMWKKNPIDVEEWKKGEEERIEKVESRKRF